MDWYIFVILAVAIIIGIVVVVKVRRKSAVGILLIDTSDPGKDIYRLELGDELENLDKRKTITLKIVRGVISRT